LLLFVAAAGCSAKHQAAASAAAVSSAIAAQPPLRPCDTRTFDAGGAQVTLLGNVDGSLGGLHVQNAEPAVSAQVYQAVRQRFGVVKRDPRVQTRPNKWGLTVLIDSCGRTVDLSGTPKPPG